MTTPQPLSATNQIYRHAQEIREALPDFSWANRTYTLAVRILNSNFGKDWVETHVLASDDQSPFFHNLKDVAGDNSLQHARVVDLAETILNLRTFQE